MIAFRGQKKVGPRPEWSPFGNLVPRAFPLKKWVGREKPWGRGCPLGFKSKFPTSIPAPFIWEYPHPGGGEGGGKGFGRQR